MKTWLLVSLGAISLIPLQAQENHRLILDLGAGFVTPVGGTGRSLDTGWSVKGGVGYNFSSVIGAMVQVESDSMGINSTTLSNIGLPGGNRRIFSTTLDPIVHLTPRKHFDLYLIGGGGMYRQSQNFDQSGVSTNLLSSYSVVKPGVNGGMGVGLGSKWGGKFYAEARYHRIFLGNDYHTDYVPVTFGFRW